MSVRLRLSLVYLLFALLAKSGLFPLQSWVTSAVVAGALLPFLFRAWALRLWPGRALAPGHPLHASTYLWMTAPALFATIILPIDPPTGRWLLLACVGIGLMMLATFHTSEGLHFSMDDTGPRHGVVALGLSRSQDRIARILCIGATVALIWNPVVPRSIETGFRMGLALHDQLGLPGPAVGR